MISQCCHTWPHGIQRNSGASSFPAKVCYNAAISACERSSYWEMAVSLLQWLPAADGISVGAVTNACARGTSLSLEKLTAGYVARAS